MTDHNDRPSDRLRNAAGDLWSTQDRLDEVCLALVALGRPESARRASQAGDRIEALRQSLLADAEALADRENTRDRIVALSSNGGIAGGGLADLEVDKYE